MRAYLLKASDEEFAAWREAAGGPLAVWIRGVLNRALEGGEILVARPADSDEFVPERGVPWWNGEKIVREFKGPDPRPGKPKRS